MKFQFISETSNNLGLAYRLKEDGHTIFFLNKARAGEGIFEKKKESSDIDILDGIHISIGDHPNKIGASRATNVLLTTPDYARLILGSRDISILDESIFTKYGIYLDEGGHPPTKSDGIELVIEAYFNGESFLKPPYLIMDFYLKKIDPEAKLYQESLKRLEAPLRAMDYKGPFGIKLIVNKDNFKVVGLERRFRYSLFETLNKKLVKFLVGLNSGSLKNLNISSQWMIELPVITLAQIDIPIEGITEENKDRIWLRDVYQKDNKLFSAGADGIVLFITAYGRTPNEAKRRAYRTFSNLMIPYARVPWIDDREIEENYKFLHQFNKHL